MTEIIPKSKGPIVAAALPANPLNPKNSHLFSAGTILLYQERIVA
jgi:hypothetical protein